MQQKVMIMKKELITDAVLVSNYIKGDESALSVLIKRHKQKIYSFIYSKVFDRDVTEDVFQDTFIKVIRTLKLGKYNEEGKFLPWVMRIAHNLVIDHFRKNSRMPKFDNSNDFNIFSVLSDSSLNAEKAIIKRTNTNRTSLERLNEIPATIGASKTNRNPCREANVAPPRILPRTKPDRETGATRTESKNPSFRSSIIEMVEKMAVKRTTMTIVPG